MYVLFMILLLLAALVLILIVLVQRGKGGGLAGAFGGMGGQSAFGTKAGDTFTRITIGVATVWILLCIWTVKMLGTSDSQLQLPGVPAASQGTTSGGAAPGGTAPAAPSGTAPAAPAAPAPEGGATK
jgi:preprotein translocase subunit SecG